MASVLSVCRRQPTLGRQAFLKSLCMVHLSFFCSRENESTSKTIVDFNSYCNDMLRVC